jgi:hypothetical protein
MALGSTGPTDYGANIAPDISSESQTDDSHEVYSPKEPDLLSTWNTGMGTLQRMMKTLYSPTPGIPTQKPATSTADTSVYGGGGTPSAPVDTGTSTDAGLNDSEKYLQHGRQFYFDNTIGADNIVGNGTTFGLDYDTGGNDAQDNGIGAFGANTRDKNLEGAAIPISVIKNSIGDYENDPKILEALRRGDYQVAVSNQEGETRIVPIVDAGPADWTGNAIDLTYRTSHELNTTGKAKVSYKLLGPDGSVMPIKGYHPHSYTVGDLNDHIGPNRKETGAGQGTAATTGDTTETEPKLTLGSGQQTSKTELLTDQEKEHKAFKSLSPNDQALYASGKNNKELFKQTPSQEEQAVLDRVEKIKAAFPKGSAAEQSKDIADILSAAASTTDPDRAAFLRKTADQLKAGASTAVINKEQPAAEQQPAAKPAAKPAAAKSDSDLPTTDELLKLGPDSTYMKTGVIPSREEYNKELAAQGGTQRPQVKMSMGGTKEAPPGLPQNPKEKQTWDDGKGNTYMFQEGQWTEI